MGYLIAAILGLLIGIWLLVSFVGLFIKIVGIIVIIIAIYGFYKFITGRRSRL